MSAAAPLLHITQPALSRSLRRLEAELGCKLFDCSPNAMAPNRCGRAAVARARAVLAAYDALVATVAEESRRSRPTRVGTCAPAPLRAVVAAMEEAALVFASLSATTPLLTFYTERAGQPPTGRTLVPIEDASAAQTFYLLWKQDGEQAQLAEQLAATVRDG